MQHSEKGSRQGSARGWLAGGASEQGCVVARGRLSDRKNVAGIEPGRPCNCGAPKQASEVAWWRA
jgi:hypothetical protein